MDERIARAVDDNEDYPVIDSVYHVTYNAPVADVTDPFAQKGEVVKTYAGTTSNFKRKVTNELKKYNRSSDRETSSKQVQDETAVSGYDVFGVVQPPHNLEGFVKIYEISAPHYAAVNAKVSNIVGLGFNLVETTKTKRAMEQEESEEKLKKIRRKLEFARDDLQEIIEGWNEEETFTEIMIKVWRDYEVMGNGYIEVGRKRDGTIGYVGHIPAQTIRVRRDRDGFVQISANKAQFFRNFGDNRANPIGDDNNPNELIHLKRYSPSSSYYGVPDVVAAQQAIAGNEFSSRFNLEYFENKAVPRHLITLKGASLGSNAQTQLLAFFETGLKGQNHRSLFIPLPPDRGTEKVEFKIEKVESDGQDSSFNQYRKSNLAEILMAHRVPVTKVSISDSASLAVARDADKTFKEQVCAPEQRVAEKKLNRIIKEFTDAFEFKFNEMTLTDADTQSKIDERGVKNGWILPNEIRSRSGMPAIKGGDKRVDLNDKSAATTRAEATTVRNRDADRSANGTDSNGEGRNPKGEGRAQS